MGAGEPPSRSGGARASGLDSVVLLKLLNQLLQRRRRRDGCLVERLLEYVRLFDLAEKIVHVDALCLLVLQTKAEGYAAATSGFQKAVLRRAARVLVSSLYFRRLP